MSGEKETEFIGWESTADVTTGAPMVKMTWQTKVKVYPLDRALATAHDLLAAAVAAESDAAVFATLTQHLGLNVGTAWEFLADVRRRRTTLQERPGARPFLRIGAVMGYNTRRPMVAVHSGSLDETLTPNDARGQAEAIYTVVAAAAIDARTRHVLGERGLDVVAVEEILAEVCALGRGKGILR